MRSIAFLLDDSTISSADLTHPGLGNPGIGGTEYNIVTLAHELAERKFAKVALFRRNPSNTYPGSITVVTVANYPGSLREQINAAGPFDCIIVRGTDTLRESAVLDCLPAELPVVIWAHNHLRSTTLSFIAGREQVKSIVYVGREQCALAAGAPTYRKSTYIYPGFYVEPRDNEARGTRAVYVGSLVPQKGFHRLARLWPRIRAASPSAALDVIGSSRVYYADQPMGALGIAAPEYEKLITRYLGKDPSRHGVTFHGKLGTEKYDVIRRALVGLPNPTGFTECCPATAVEMSQCGAAVVAFRQWGMCDTVVDRTTGYLCRDDREYVDRVVSLFEHPEHARELGRNGQTFVRETFSYDVICSQWERLFGELRSSTAPHYSVPEIAGSYPFRRLRLANNSLRSPQLHWAINFADRVRGVFLKRY